MSVLLSSSLLVVLSKRSEEGVCGTKGLWSYFLFHFWIGGRRAKNDFNKMVCTTFENGFSYLYKCLLILLIFNKWGWIRKHSMFLNIFKSNTNMFADF